MLFSNSIKFPNMFNLDTGDTDIEKEYKSINKCLALILTTGKGELLGDPDFGCTLYEQLFNNYTDALKDIIITDIIESINNYEKRIIVYKDDITIEQDENNEHLFYIHINYKVKNTPFENSADININVGEENI